MAFEQLLDRAAEFKDGLEFGIRMRIMVAAGLISALYLRSIVSKVAPGGKSLILTVPVLLVNLSMPLMFDKTAEILSMVTMLLALTWLASFKVCVSRPSVRLCVKTCNRRALPLS